MGMHMISTRASGGKAALRRVVEALTLRFRATGYKSSEGDGRTAADIRRELAAKAGKDD